MKYALGIIVLVLAAALIVFLFYKGTAFIDKVISYLELPIATTTPPATQIRSASPPPSRPTPPSGDSNGRASPPPVYSGEIPQGFRLEDLSHYFGKITISYISPLRETFFTSSAYSEVNIYTNLSQGEEVRITGWKVQSNRDSFLIPKGVADYNPNLSYNEPVNIAIKSGDQVKIFSHSSARGLNLRLNQCTGYIKDSTPEMPRNCPYIGQSEIYTFTGECQSYIRTLGSCEFPIHNPPIPYSDTACYDFLRQLNYQGCYNKYRSKPDFFSHEWRIWLATYPNPQKNIFDPEHDRVLLFDREGKLVDEYVY